MNCSPPGSSVHGIFQARILEWVAISSSWESSRPRDWIYGSRVSCIGRQILHPCTTWEALLKSLPPQAPSTTTPSKLTTLGASLVGPRSAVLRRLVVSNPLWPTDCSPPGSSVHGIFLARTLEWVAVSFSTGSSQPRDWTRVSYVFCIAKWILYHQHRMGSPVGGRVYSNSVFSTEIFYEPETALKNKVCEFSKSQSFFFFPEKKSVIHKYKTHHGDCLSSKFCHLLFSLLRIKIKVYIQTTR